MMGKKRRSTGDFVYDELKKNIIQQVFKPNERLSEEAIAISLGVSRTPLRQALSQLESEKLVIKKRNGGMFVAPLSIEEAVEIYKVREVLEGLVAKEATMQMTNEGITKMGDTLSLIDRAYKEKRDTDVIEYGFQFHYILYQLSKNHTAVHFLNQIKNRIARYRQVGEYKQSRYLNRLPNKEHQYIFKLIQQGDENQVEIEMRAHIRRSLETTIDSIEKLEYYNE